MLNVPESTVRFAPLWCSDHQTAPLLGFSSRAPSDRFCISLKHNQRKQVPRLMSGYLQQHFHKAKSARDKDKARLTEEALFPLVFPTLIIAQHLQTQPGERVGSLTRSELGEKKKTLISRNMIQSFWVLSLCQAEVPVYYRKILILPLTFASCLVTSILCLHLWCHCELRFVALTTWSHFSRPETAFQNEKMTFKCRHDGTKAEWRLSLCRRTLFVSSLLRQRCVCVCGCGEWGVGGKCCPSDWSKNLE